MRGNLENTALKMGLIGVYVGEGRHGGDFTGMGVHNGQRDSRGFEGIIGRVVQVFTGTRKFPDDGF